jgi:hypothetical protein
MATGYTVRHCRHLLRAVGELHGMGYELVRVAPHLADSAGGGRWWCALVPAELIAPDRGAELADPLAFPRLERNGYPCYPLGSTAGLIDDEVPPVDTAGLILRHYPRLAERGRGRDAEYALWYADMLRLTEPEGLVIATYWGDRSVPWSGDPLRVVGGASASATVSPPPVRSGASPL